MNAWANACAKGIAGDQAEAVARVQVLLQELLELGSKQPRGKQDMMPDAWTYQAVFKVIDVSNLPNEVKTQQGRAVLDIMRSHGVGITLAIGNVLKRLSIQ
jgi:hypothetical protein